MRRCPENAKGVSMFSGSDGVDLSFASIMFGHGPNEGPMCGGVTMSILRIVIACLSLLALAGCGNTVRGMKQDGVQTSNALDDATRRIAAADAN